MPQPHIDYGTLSTTPLTMRKFKKRYGNLAYRLVAHMKKVVVSEHTNLLDLRVIFENRLRTFTEVSFRVLRWGRSIELGFFDTSLPPLEQHVRFACDIFDLLAMKEESVLMEVLEPVVA